MESTLENLVLPAPSPEGLTDLALAEWSDSIAAPVTRREAPAVRVLHVVNGEHYAGAERVQDLLALGLPGFGYEVGFACLKADKFPGQRHSRATPLVELRRRSKVDPRTAFDLARLARDEGYSLLHSHGPRAAMIASLASRIAKIPLVHHMHSPAAADTNHAFRDRFVALAERWSLRRPDVVITVSNSLGRFALRQGVAAQRLKVIHNGVAPLGGLTPRATPHGAWTLGMVALFRPRKGLETLLEAMAELAARGRITRLRAIGAFETPDYERKSRELTERLGLTQVVEWTGFARDVPAELAKLDLFVLPSLFGEGLPMVLLEAMAAGVPAVATRVEGIPEAIRDTVDGLLVAPQDPRDLAAAIEGYLDGRIDWRRARESAWRRQAESFSDASMARGVAAVYDHVLDSRRAPAQRPNRASGSNPKANGNPGPEAHVE